MSNHQQIHKALQIHKAEGKTYILEHEDDKDIFNCLLCTAKTEIIENMIGPPVCPSCGFNHGDMAKHIHRNKPTAINPNSNGASTAMPQAIASLLGNIQQQQKTHMVNKLAVWAVGTLFLMFGTMAFVIGCFVGHFILK